MPEVTGDPIIRHVWRPRHDPARIHYLAISGAHEVHLAADESDPIHTVLNDALEQMGKPGISYPGRAENGVPPLVHKPRPVVDRVARLIERPVAWMRRRVTVR
jgi:hypothetical protein